MLNFKLDLTSPLFMNVKAYKIMRQLYLQRQRLDFKEAYKKLRDLFPDMNDLQFFEVDYEFSELRAIERKIERSPHLDYNGRNSQVIRQVLNARSEPDFSVPDKFIQVMGRGTRSNINPAQAMSRRRFDGNNYLPRAKE